MAQFSGTESNFALSLQFKTDIPVLQPSLQRLLSGGKVFKLLNFTSSAVTS
jgi:hypothetical protein